MFFWSAGLRMRLIVLSIGGILNHHQRNVNNEETAPAKGRSLGRTPAVPSWLAKKKAKALRADWAR